MRHYITPILFFAAAVYVYQHNSSSTDSVLLFPFIDVIFPATEGNLRLKAEATVKLLIALGGISTLWELGRGWRYRQHLKRTLKEPRS